MVISSMVLTEAYSKLPIKLWYGSDAVRPLSYLRYAIEPSAIGVLTGFASDMLNLSIMSKMYRR
jgi:hypothetical protein